MRKTLRRHRVLARDPLEEALKTGALVSGMIGLLCGLALLLLS